MDRQGSSADQHTGETAIPGELRAYVEECAATVHAFGHYDRQSFAVEADADAAENTDVQAVIEDLRLQNIERRHQESLYVLGNLHCTVRAFDDGLALHFIEGADRGTILVVAPGTPDELTAFIDDVLEILDEHSVPRPEWPDAG